MRNFVLKQSILVVLYCFFALAFEIVTFVNLKIGVLPQYFILDIVLILTFAVVLFVLPNHFICFVSAVIMLVTQVILSFININLYRNRGEIFTWDMVSLAGEAFDKNVLKFVDFGVVSIFFLCLLIFVALSILTIKYFKGTHLPFKSKHAFFMSAVIFFSSCILPLFYNVQINALNVDVAEDGIVFVNDLALYNDMEYKLGFFVKFGTFPMYVKNILLGEKFGFTDTVPDHIFYDYFSTSANYAHSEFWGADRGNNLIFVMLESVDTFLIDSSVTPTLYNLRENGINFTNYYSKSYTEVSELSLILGSYPQDHDVKWDDADYVLEQNSEFWAYSVPNRLKANGFDTANYFHPNSGAIYSRQNNMTKYGFDSAGFIQDYDYVSMRPDEKFFINGWTPDNYASSWAYPEEWFLELALDDIMPAGKRFFSQVLTINAHGTYASALQEIPPYYHELFANTFPEGTPLSFWHYAIIKAKAVDQGVKFLLDNLEARGILDKTTILFVTDHEAYSNNLAGMMKNAKTNESPLYNVPAFIYSPNVKNISIDKFTCIFDMVPTVFQLLGIDLNSRFYFGYDAFGPSESVHFPKSGGVYNDKFFSLDGVSILWQSEKATRNDLRRFQAQAGVFRNRMPYFNALFKNGSPPGVL